MLASYKIVVYICTTGAQWSDSQSHGSTILFSEARTELSLSLSLSLSHK